MSKPTDWDRVFDADKFRRLKVAYATAKKCDLVIFVFDGDEYITQFAKYLIEYLETKL